MGICLKHEFFLGSFDEQIFVLWAWGSGGWGRGAMKMALSLLEASVDALVDLRFGRARFFGIVGEESGDETFLDNEAGGNAAHGAGTQAAQMLARAGVQVVLTGRVGPKAWSALKAGGIAVYCVEGGTGKQALEAFRAGKLSEMTSGSLGHGTLREVHR
jgi:predicted Fe-Mo cluster-binding NifX family protein